MPLDLPDLDVRSFDQLKQEALRLIPRLAPEWTDWNAHDPGITLIELFAHLYESNFYTLNRVSDASLRSFLYLLGYAPEEPKQAKTVIQFQVDQVLNIPAILQVADGPGEALDTADEVAPIIFETDNAILALPVNINRYLTSLEGRLLEHKQMNKAFHPLAKQFSKKAMFLLGFDQSLSTDLEGVLSLYFKVCDPEKEAEQALLRKEHLEEINKTLPHYCDSSIADPDHHYSVKLAWEYHHEDEGWLPLEIIEDDTRALSNSGFIRFTPPEKHHAGIPDNNSCQTFTDSYFIRCRILEGNYDCTPKINGIIFNAVQASHQRTMPSKTAESNGSGGQIINILNDGILPDQFSLTVDGDAWQKVSEFDRSFPHDKHYKLDSEEGEIHFGNGLTARIPKAGAAIEYSYFIGGGSQGNLRAASLNTILENNHNLGIAGLDIINASIHQPYPAWGGRDKETIVQSQARVYQDLHHVKRAVSLADFESLALETPGVPVARAKAIACWHPQYNCIKAAGVVTVVVISDCADFNPMPTDELLAEVRNYLEMKRLISSEVYVIGPDYITLNISAAIHLEPSAIQEQVHQQIEDELKNFVSPISGAKDGKGWPIGQAVYRAEILAQMQSIKGVAFIEHLGLSMNGGPELCGNLELCPNSLITMGQVKIEFK